MRDEALRTSARAKSTRGVIYRGYIGTEFDNEGYDQPRSPQPNIENKIT